MMFLFYVLALAVSFYLLARIADGYFVDSLEKIAKKINMSQDAAGATLMAVGSSAPELFVAIMALVKPGGHADIGMGSIVGSAIFNVLVIVGASAVVKKAVLYWQPVVRDSLFYSISILLLIWSFWDGKISLTEAIVFAVVYVIYIVAVIYWREILPYQELIDDIEETTLDHKTGLWATITKPFDWALDKFFPNKKRYGWVFGISIFLIAILSWVLVESAVEVAHVLHVPPVVIALTILAAGTSVPDLISSLVVAKKGKGGMAISNAFGSNIFDILVGLGFPWIVMLAFFAKGEEIVVSTENLLSSIILLFATVFVVFFMLAMRKWKIGHRAGYFLIGLYVVYLIWVVTGAVMSSSAGV